MGNKGEDYISVSLPYGEDERFAMVAVLPDDMDTFTDGLTEESLSGILNTFYEKHEALVQLPVFEMEQKLRLNDALCALGIEKAFSQNEADFTGMSEDDILFIDEVLHKAKIKVDEEGTEAAAATSVDMALKAAPPTDRFEFIADKPFLFFIVDTENDLVLFTGKVLDFG
jgi:serpin B